MAAGSDVVLSFHDSLVRKSDLKLLNKDPWNRCFPCVTSDPLGSGINWKHQYFEKEQFAGLSSDVSFVGPQVTQCFKLLSADEAKVLIEPLCLMNKRLVFFAVNDNMSRDNTGGSHWSLLVLSILDKVCHHYDSMHQGNEDSAMEIFRILKPMLGGDLRYEHGKCPQQTNSHDCGVYVICVTEYICSQRFNPSKSPVTINDAVNSETVSRKRDQLKEIIHNLAKL